MIIPDHFVGDRRQIPVLVERDHFSVRGEYCHFFKRHLNGLRNLSGFLLVGVRGCKHNDEERKQEGDEVRVRYKPPLMIDMFGMLFLASHYAAAAFLPLLAATCSARSFWYSSSRKDVSLP